MGHCARKHLCAALFALLQFHVLLSVTVVGLSDSEIRLKSEDVKTPNKISVQDVASSNLNIETIQLIRNQIAIGVNKSLDLHESLKELTTISTATAVSVNQAKVDNESSEWWTLETTLDSAFDILRGNNKTDDTIIRIRKVSLDDNLIHTCYEYRNVPLTLAQLATQNHTGSESSNLIFRSGTFCYPSIVVTGMRKCSTSAMYKFLSSLPRALKAIHKENCVFLGKSRSIFQYFASLPRSVRLGEIVVDGCVDMRGNMRLRLCPCLRTHQFCANRLHIRLLALTGHINNALNTSK